MSQKLKIWFLEDDLLTRKLYATIFESRFDVEFFPTIALLRQHILVTKDRPDLIIADIRLPDGNLLDFLNTLRTELSTVRILAVSQLDDVMTLKGCFKGGVIDYLTKPFNQTELLVKVELILGGEFGFVSGLQLDYDAFTLRNAEASSAVLTGKEMKIVSLFLRSPKYEVTRQQLIANVWSEKPIAQKTLDVHIFNLRRKLVPAFVHIQFHHPHTYSLQVVPRQPEIDGEKALG